MSDEDDLLILEKLEPTGDDFISRRINHRPFAKIVFWLCHKSKSEDFVYSSELKQFMKFSSARAYSILRDLCDCKILRRNEKTSNLVEFHFLKNNNAPLILKFLPSAKKTLGLGL
ncbi:MAG: hypothetical protein AABY22_10735 [Nanoarchaeota archaeon]